MLKYNKKTIVFYNQTEYTAFTSVHIAVIQKMLYDILCGQASGINETQQAEAL